MADPPGTSPPAPLDAAALRLLAAELTHDDVYEHNARLREELIRSGAIAEAIALRQEALRLEGGGFRDYLRIGIGFTALGDSARAAQNISRATDLHLAKARPDLAAADRWSSEPLLPQFFIIGSAKCGTTALFRYIAAHPHVLPPVQKEIHYFLYPDRGLDWYRAHFPKAPLDGCHYLTGEASVSTINLHTAPAMLRTINPKARLIALARDPVDRAISQYYNYLTWGIESRTLDQAIAEELDMLGNGEGSVHPGYWQQQHGYIAMGLYSRELERWRAETASDQLLILITEEMQHNPQGTAEEVFRHLELPAFGGISFARHHEGTYDTQDQRAARERLAAFFARHNEQFFELIGRRLDWADSGRGPSRLPLAMAASRARIKARQQRWADAAPEWQSCLTEISVHPGRRAWLQGLGQALVALRDWAAAWPIFQELNAKHPTDSSGPAGLARIAQEQGNEALAAEWRAQCLARFQDHPDRAQWLVPYAEWLVRDGDGTAAAAAVEELLSRHPGIAAGYYCGAQLETRRQNKAKAAWYWNACLSRFPDEPSRSWWLTSYAQVLIDLGQIKQADGVIDTLIIAFPDEPGGLACLARLYQHRSDDAKAAQIWAECLTRFPAHPERSWWLPSYGHTLLRLQRYGAAEHIFRAATETCPEDPNGWAGLARAVQLQCQAERAAKLWEDCLHRFPSHAERRWWLPAYGHTLLDMGAAEQGEAMFRIAQEYFPDDPSTAEGLTRAISQRQTG